MKYLILGYGIAGKTAAQNIKFFDQSAEITIVTDSGKDFYFRPNLTGLLGKNDSFSEVISCNNETLDSVVVVEKKVVRIDDENDQVILEDKSVIPYDKLLIAIGNEIDFPQKKGIEKKDVLGLSRLSDFLEFREKLGNYSKISVIGGGFLGVEIALVLKEMGKSVNLIEREKQLMKSHLDWHASELIMTSLIKSGIEVITNENIHEITENEKSGKTVKFESGLDINCDAVIIATGVRFNSNILGDSKIIAEKRILVNDNLQTSVKNIYCAGDAAYHRGVVYGNWNAAREQGEIVGMIMAGEDVLYKGSVNEYRLKVKNIEIYCVGRTVNSSGEVLIAKEGCIYRKLIVDDDKPIGAIVLNDPFTASIAEAVFKGEKSVVSLKKYF